MATADEHPETCSTCGGELPAPHGPKLDRLDKYLTRDGYCPGRLTVDRNGRVLGCGAWKAEAYTSSTESE